MGHGTEASLSPGGLLYICVRVCVGVRVCPPENMCEDMRVHKCVCKAGCAQVCAFEVCGHM